MPKIGGMNDLAKKRGRPKVYDDDRVRVWHRYSRETLAELEELVSFLKRDAPPFALVNQQTVIAALIHEGKRRQEEGKLAYSNIFGELPAEVADA